MKFQKKVRVCRSCHGTERVVDVKVQVRKSPYLAASDSFELCEDCLTHGADLAKLALELQGGPLTLGETLSNVPHRTVNSALDHLAKHLVEAYARLRGVK